MQEGNWVDFDGNALLYANWRSNQLGIENDWVHFGTSGKWIDVTEDRKKTHIVCVKGKILYDSTLILHYFVIEKNGDPQIGGNTTRPAYLDVPEYLKCVGELKSGPTTFHCKPLEQAADCPNDSWSQLYGENGVAVNFSDCKG